MNSKIKIILFFLAVFSVSLTVRAQDETLTNQEIIAMTDAKVSKSIIIQKIRVSKANFNLSTASIIALKNAQVDDEVVSEMFKAKSSNSIREVAPSLRIDTVMSPTPTPTPIPQTPSTNGATVDSDKPVDPTCIQNQLDATNTSNRTKDICDLVRLVVVEDPAEINVDNSSRALISVVLDEFLKKNKIDLTDVEKTQAAIKFFLEADKKRTDKQVGSNPNSSGTTSLAVKGGAPSVIGWAIEQGAATSSINGTTVTVRVNPFGLLRAIQGEGFFSRQMLNSFTATASKNKFTDSNTKPNNFLRKFSLGFSFDTTRGQETPTLIVSKQQLSAVSVRYEFINQRTPQSSKAQQLFRDFVLDVTDILKEYGNVVTRLTDNNGVLVNERLKNWLDVTNAELKTVLRFRAGDLVDKRRYEEAIRAVLEKRLAGLPIDEILNDPDTKQSFQRFTELTLEYVKRRDSFTKEVNKGTVATFEYTNNREPVAPDTSNFRFIWENGHFFKRTDFTFNASLTMYNKKPTFANVKRIRDFQFALQTDTSLGDTFGTGDTTLTFAGRYERLNSD
ncbi:MAG: hypothetical protein ABJA66_03295, partial [Actinomycetota bacterium]